MANNHSLAVDSGHLPARIEITSSLFSFLVFSGHRSSSLPLLLDMDLCGSSRKLETLPLLIFTSLSQTQLMLTALIHYFILPAWGDQLELHSDSVASEANDEMNLQNLVIYCMLIYNFILEFLLEWARRPFRVLLVCRVVEPWIYGKMKPSWILMRWRRCNLCAVGSFPSNCMALLPCATFCKQRSFPPI